MKITAIETTNLRGFQDVNKTMFSTGINIFIGPNNSGKSTILNAIFGIQKKRFERSDVTLGRFNGHIDLYFSGSHGSIKAEKYQYLRIILDDKQDGLLGLEFEDFPLTAIPYIASTEPKNLIYPYLSKRKTVDYSHEINENNTNSVTGDFGNLYSKIDRLINPQYRPHNQQYVKACEDILGFQVSTIHKGRGKQAVYYVEGQEHISLTAMGEGVANILGLVTDLCVAENRIFLIEEPENDIHPKALKSLLKLIIEKSETNQFFISTHSNIVMKYLGAEKESKVFNVTNEQRDENRPDLFISTINEVSKNQEDRRRVLEDLGYDFFDFDLWKGWLFLEESSAETIIKYLIDWFVPQLKSKIRTFSTGGTSKLLPKFEDFNRLFVFLHLEPTYLNKVWVKIDGGSEEETIINQLKEIYAKRGWVESNFGQFRQHEFESYYPTDFAERISVITTITDKQAKRQEKKTLLDDVKKWIAMDEQTAKDAFKVSAAEIIEFLDQINTKLV